MYEEESPQYSVTLKQTMFSPNMPAKQCKPISRVLRTRVQKGMRRRRRIVYIVIISKDSDSSARFMFCIVHYIFVYSVSYIRKYIIKGNVFVC